MIEAKGKEQKGRRNPQNEGKDRSGNGGVFSGVSLQDVFSDSPGSSGLMLKTPCPSADEAGRPEMDGGNASQLGVPGTKRKRRVGRKELTVEQQRTRKLQLHLTENEYLVLWQHQITLGRKSMADYLRELVLAEKATKQAMNKAELIRRKDQIGQALGKTVLNIHEIAINLSKQEKNQCVGSQTIHQFNPDYALENLKGQIDLI